MQHIEKLNCSVADTEQKCPVLLFECLLPVDLYRSQLGRMLTHLSMSGLLLLHSMTWHCPWDFVW